MAHPQEVDVAQRQKREHLSPLMRAKAAAGGGVRTNACPYGCEMAQLDEHGYCRHLVGFTNDGKGYEPLVRRGGRRVVQVERVADPSQPPDEDGQAVTVPELQPVREDDRLVRVTVSSRVYRDVDGQGERIRLRREEEARARRLEERRQWIAEIKQDDVLRRELLEALSGPGAG